MIKINKYLRNLTINSLPGILSIFLSIFSIPVYLKYLDLEKYGNFIFLHIILSIVMVTNLNLGKIASVRMQKVSEKKIKGIISTTIMMSATTSLFITLVIFFIYMYISNLLGVSLFNEYILVFFALFLSNIYVTLENLCKGKKFYLLSSFANLIFYSFSVSLPSIFLICSPENYKNINNLFEISVLLKLIGMVLLISYLINRKLFDLKNFSKNIINDFFLYSKWQTLSSVYLQIFDFLDKYIIKLILGSANLAIYTIPQQISGKLSVISDALISVFLPKVSGKNSIKDKKTTLNSNFYAFFYFIGIILILLGPILENLIILWLGNNTDLKILYLFNIFIITSFYICLTHIMSTYLDTVFKSKKNFQIDTVTLFLFLIGIIISVKSNDIYFFAYTCLIKSILSFFLKIKYLHKLINNFNILIIQNIVLLTIFYFILKNQFYLYMIAVIIFILFFLKNSQIRILKKEFYK